MVVDYGKWEHMDFDDSDGDYEDADTMNPAEALSRGSPFLNSDVNAVLRKLRLNSKKSHVYIDPADDTSTLHETFYEDPKKFKPEPVPDSNRYRAWGLLNDEDWYDEMPVMMRRMQTQFLYGELNGKPETPEQQFVEVLKSRKMKALEKERAQTDSLRKCDFILKIQLDDLPVWRRVRVSGGMSLPTFQDKVLTPVVGWVRNYHAYLFTDQRDGALFGPKESTAIDMMHMALVGWDFLDDSKYELCRLLTHQCAILEYLYDLGDRWDHTITLEEIIPEEQSTGKCVLMSGEGGCPPEDAHGNFRYGENVIKAWTKGSAKVRKALQADPEQSNALNYKGRKFDPFAFDLEEAARRLADAIASRNSVRFGAKHFIYPVVPGATSLFGGDDLQKGQHVKKTPMNPGGCMECEPFMEEVIGDAPDDLALSICAHCGNPHNLRRCMGCLKESYCGQECQRGHWKVHKRACRK